MLEQRFLSALALSLGTIALTVSSIALVEASSGPTHAPRPAATLAAEPPPSQFVDVPASFQTPPCWPARDAGR